MFLFLWWNLHSLFRKTEFSIIVFLPYFEECYLFISIPSLCFPIVFFPGTVEGSFPPCAYVAFGFISSWFLSFPQTSFPGFLSISDARLPIQISSSGCFVQSTLNYLGGFLVHFDKISSAIHTFTAYLWFIIPWIEFVEYGLRSISESYCG